MYLSQLTAMEWALDNMTETQIQWLARRNWYIDFAKHVFATGDDLINYHFFIAAELKDSKDLSFAQLLFSDADLAVVE